MATILIIEDDPQTRKMMRQILEYDGYDITEAENGKEGVALFGKNPVDLIITDIIMPEQEGLETIKELRADFPGVKIIAVSGGGRLDPKNYLDMAKQFGAAHTIKKPFQMDELLLTVKELLQKD